uniref:NPC1_N domain-containing protein n=1 Tax=Brugia timori TaxID=42155 RepID=A0A0R3R0L8_9BILA
LPPSFYGPLKNGIDYTKSYVNLYDYCTCDACYSVSCYWQFDVFIS